MNSKLKALFAFLFVIITTAVHSQELNHDNAHHHHHHKYELGVANSLVYLPHEKEVAYGLHLHFVRKINHSKFGYGLAYERIFDEHAHNFFGIVGNYNPFERLHLNLTPGITLGEDELARPKFAFHTETSYDFNIGDFHIGPLLEVAIDAEDYHIGLGLHIGYGF